MTGQELYKQFQQDAGYAYTGNLDTTKANRLFKKALISSLEKKYRELLNQKEYDEIRQIIKTEKVFTPTNNEINITAILSISTLTYTAAPNSVMTATTTTAHGLSTGATVTISGASGIATTPALAYNGTFTVTVLNGTQFTYAIVNSAISGVYTSGSGSVATATVIGDYWHLLAVRAKFIKNTYLTITNATNATPVVLTIKERNNLRTGEKVSIASVGGNTNANGVRYLKQVNSFNISLYSDKDLQAAIAGNGAYTSGGTLSRIFYEFCSKVFSDQKLAPLAVKTIYDPGAEITENLLRFYPLDEVCSEITMDYLTQPPAAMIINVADSAIDLDKYMPLKFQYFIVEEARSIYAQKYRDDVLLQQANMEQGKNQ